MDEIFFPHRLYFARLSCKSLGRTGLVAGLRRTLGMFDYAEALGGCARGDRTALRRLYEEEAGRMIAISQRIVRRRDLAEEVVQDAFMQIWRKAGSYDAAIGSARSWIYAIVRNRSLNLIRDGAREDLVDAEDLDRAREEDTDIGDAFDRLSSDSALRRCLAALEPEKRESILLSYVAGYSHGEIAAHLRIPLGTAKSWVRRALLALRDCMA
jgi:RNA polymerase sigma-70 factor (ECF subfamily)